MLCALMPTAKVAANKVNIARIAAPLRTDEFARLFILKNPQLMKFPNSPRPPADVEAAFHVGLDAPGVAKVEKTSIAGMIIEQQIMGCRSTIIVRPNRKVSRPKHNRGVHWAKSAPLVPHHGMVLGYEALCWQEHGAFFSACDVLFSGLCKAITL